MGVDFTRRWSVWLYSGTDDPNDEDVRAAAADRLNSWLIVLNRPGFAGGS